MTPPPTNIDGSDITGATIDGQNVDEITIDGSVVFSAAAPIPDQDIFLHDDFGDNKLQNRDGSGTTTTNGLTGTFRPEYNIVAGSPQATNQEYTCDTGDEAKTTALPDLRGVSARFDIDISGTQNPNLIRPAIWITSTAAPATGSDTFPESYFFDIQPSFDVFRFRKQGAPQGSQSDVIVADQAISTPLQASVTHDGNGNWELFLDGVSQGTGFDTEYTNTEPLAFGFAGLSGAATVSEIKVHP